MKCLGLPTTCAARLALLVLLSVGGAPARAAVTMTVRAVAQVSGPSVYLKDIASLAGPAAAVGKLGGIEVGTSPLPGYSRRIDASMLRVRLRQAGVDVVWAPESAFGCEVSRKCQMLDPQRIVDAAIATVQGQVTSGAGRAAAEAVTKPRPVRLPEGEVSLEPEMGGGSGGTYRLVHVHVLVDGKSCASVPISVRVRRYARLLVAIRPIARGAAITADVVEAQELDLTGITGDLMPIDMTLDGLVASGTIAAGVPLTRANVGQPPSVKRGDAVTMVVRIGGIEVRASGVAAEDGRVGQPLRVRNATSNEDVRGTLVGPREVEVLR